MTVEDRQNAARDETVDGAIEPETGRRGAIPDGAGWRNLWQIPTLVVSLALIATALLVGRTSPDEGHIDVALAAVAQDVSERRLEAAAARLTDRLDTNIETATREQRALYHALRADVIALSRDPMAASIAASGAVVDDYARAEAHGARLEPAQIGRWLEALLVLGDVTTAKQRWDELTTRLRVDPAAGLPAWRMRQLERRMIECAFQWDAFDDAELAAMIDAYRRQDGLAPDDLAWIAMRRADLSLRTGDAARAVDRLLVAMRRLEDVEIAQETWGELHAALGVAYLGDGQPDAAIAAIDEALALLPELDDRRGRAMVSLADAYVATSQLERAQLVLDGTLDAFETPTVVEPARFARTHVRSELGDHAGSADDFRVLIERIAVGSDGVDVDADAGIERIIERLIDRHDACVAAGDLVHAVAYLDAATAGGSRIAEDPAVVLCRAETYAAIAERDQLDVPVADLVARHQVGRSYRVAADAYAQHADLLAGEAGETWADSTWRAADCYDRAGRRDLAIEHFQSYIEKRPEIDPRRAAAIFRRARALEADEDYESAAKGYEMVIATYPRTPFATRSRVPLARCYAVLERHADAVSLLTEVVEGGVPVLTPDALDYRDALVALGRLHHDRARFAAAIECLDEALHRHPDDPRVTETRFLLAESHRRYALELGGHSVSVRQRAMQTAAVRARFETALAEYEAVCATYETRAAESMNAYQSDLHRYASLYRGDCLFELERFEAAAAVYEQAAFRFREHPSSIHALVQIVNCYDRLGNQIQADIAHRTAKHRLQGLPEAAFDDPTVLMNREAWNRWLESRPIELAGVGDGIESD